MATATKPESVLENFHIEDFLGQRTVGNTRVITLRPGQTTPFKTLDGEDAEIEVRSMRVNSCAAVNHPDDTPTRANFNMQIFIDYEVRMEGKPLSYFTTPLADLPKHIYGQNWQTAPNTALEIVRFLVNAGFTFNDKPRKQEGQKFGNRWTCTAGQPELGEDNNPDWSNYGVQVTELVVGSTYAVVPERAQGGFRDFATEANDIFAQIIQANEIEDTQARIDHKLEMSKFILSATGGREDGWPRNAQINKITLAGNGPEGEVIEKEFNLWESPDHVVNLDVIIPVAAQDPGNTPADIAAAVTPPEANQEEPF